MVDERQLNMFLEELTALSRKHGIVILPTEGHLYATKARPEAEFRLEAQDAEGLLWIAYRDYVGIASWFEDRRREHERKD